MVWNGCSFYVQKSKKNAIFWIAKSSQTIKQNFFHNILNSDFFLIEIVKFQ